MSRKGTGETISSTKEVPEETIAEPGASKVEETDEEKYVQSSSTSSPIRFLKALVSKSPSTVEKGESSKRISKKTTKAKKSGKKSKNVAKEKDAESKESLSTAKDSERSTKRAMVQTNLSTTKEGIEVISSPEQPHLKSQKKKSDKKSRSSQPSGKQSIEKGKKQTRITNLFPVRKSSRKCKSDQEKDDIAKITQAILSKKADGLEERNIEDKGRGVFATQPFSRNEFICEYDGERISYKEAIKREKKYAGDKDIGCYMYYLRYGNNKYCIDATVENGTFGRLLNHSRSGNCKTKLHAIKNKPHLILIADRDIEEGEELTYDYGDRSKDAIDSHPWLKS